jgi:hypothetical protein
LEHRSALDKVINNCDKAIVCKFANLNANSLKIDNCMFGIMNFNASMDDFDVTCNYIRGAYLGVQAIGDFANYNISDNYILSNAGITNGTTVIMPPIAIDLKPFIAATTGGVHIVNGNKINLTSRKGTGIMK